MNQDAIKLIAARARQLSAGGFFDANSAADMPSPCISVCRMACDGAHCEGCLRTLQEIAQWSAATPLRRRAIWQAVLERAGIAQQCANFHAPRG